MGWPLGWKCLLERWSFWNVAVSLFEVKSYNKKGSWPEKFDVQNSARPCFTSSWTIVFEQLPCFPTGLVSLCAPAILTSRLGKVVMSCCRGGHRPCGTFTCLEDLYFTRENVSSRLLRPGCKDLSPHASPQACVCFCFVGGDAPKISQVVYIYIYIQSLKTIGNDWTMPSRS